MDPSCFGFRLASWNANGKKSRIVEVSDFIDKHHPDVFLIQESHLGPGDSIHFPNYTVYRTDRPHTINTRPRGGTAILLKSSLPHHHTPTPPMGTVEATSVTLTPPGGDPLVITSLYISPSVSYQHIHTDVEALFCLGSASIICGDFNAHHISWGCQRNDNRGNIIKNLIDNTDTQIVAPTTPTRFGHNCASIIDFALTRNIHWLSQVESIAELSSDHNPLIISFDTNRRFAFPRRIVTTDWAAFRELLSPAHYTFHPITAGTGEDVDTQVADLTDAIINTHALSSKPIRGRNSYYVSDEIRQLMIERNRARKTWQFTRDPSDKRVLNNIQNRIHRKVKAFQNKIWEDELRALDPDDGSLWEMSKELRKKKSPVYALNGQGGIAHTDSDKAEKAQIKRAPGREGITNKILRNLTLPVIFQITNIISNIFITGHFPESWKHASVIPILKPRKPRSAADSYRPISLLPVLSKLAERLILSRLNDFLATNKILISQQHGFRPQLSTSHQLLRVVEYAKSGFKEKNAPGPFFWTSRRPSIVSFAVRVNDTHSSTKQIRAGAPQGALLSPTLFNIYINDIPKTRQTTVCLYADDTAILTQSTNKNCITHFLHRHLAELEDWYKKWKISINPEKTEAVFFSLGCSTRKPPPIHVQNHPVPWSRSVNYLGVTLDEHLSFKDHIIKINNKFRALACLYYPYFTRNSPLSIKNRLLIYTSILRPVLLYASPVWGHATKSNINRLEFSQNIMIRKLTNSPWFVRNEDLRFALNLTTVRETIKKIATKFFTNLELIDNRTLRKIEIYTPDPNFNRPRNILL
ncbi:probable RNA-directed DNA polymerase from transposon X-element [Trichonephila clavipes]|nr:probable RNA-directed DNA polymerase from transposon X-element [Trichonephila clavipes]